jgi:hypothetical protein
VTTSDALFVLLDDDDDDDDGDVDVDAAAAEVDAMLAVGEDDAPLEGLLDSSLDSLDELMRAPGAPVVYTDEGIRLKRELEEALRRRDK